MSVLFINACVRENSRTLVLARFFLEECDGEVVELNLEKEKIQPLNRELLEKRSLLIDNEQWDDEMLRYAHQFAEADEIVIAAPFWDLGFPALLKIYIEAITVSGIAFRYNEGRPKGFCKAKKLTYITTAGGRMVADFGYTYIKALARGFYGIQSVKCIYAENLDIDLISPDEVLTKCKIITIE
jgi:FMN-dependent NADH-azoreductase